MFAPIPKYPSLSGLRTLVVGLGRFGGGVGVTQWLVGQGATVTVTDQAEAGLLTESLEAIAGLPVTLHLGGHDACDLSQTDLAVINPAVIKSTSALFQEILRRKISWTTEMNLFCERCPAPVIGVTGSFGKSTTCAMLAHVLETARAAGQVRFSAIHLGGNIGRSLLGDLAQIRPSDLVVLEMSNAQLEDIDRIAWGPSLAVITNLYPHHLDRYENFTGYVQAKLKLVLAGNRTCPVIHGALDPNADTLLKEVVGVASPRLVPVTKSDPPIELIIPGLHNQVNAQCVLAVCDALGVSEASARQALRSFRGLPHRLELVGEVGGVNYVNDSKSTAPPATMIALESLRGNWGRIIGIVGGQRKSADFGECARCLAQACRVVVCYGEAGPAFAEALRKTNAETANCQIVDARSLEVVEVHGVTEAVRVAASRARRGETVLFSPGAPSFDQYVNFTERGRHFCTLVKSLECPPVPPSR